MMLAMSSSDQTIGKRFFCCFHFVFSTSSSSNEFQTLFSSTTHTIANIMGRTVSREVMISVTCGKDSHFFLREPYSSSTILPRFLMLTGIKSIGMMSVQN